MKSLAEIYTGITSGSIAQSDLILFPIGVIAAAISGYLAIRFLMRYMTRPLHFFGPGFIRVHSCVFVVEMHRSG